MATALRHICGWVCVGVWLVATLPMGDAQEAAPGTPAPAATPPPARDASLDLPLENDLGLFGPLPETGGERVTPAPTPPETLAAPTRPKGTSSPEATDAMSSPQLPVGEDLEETPKATEARRSEFKSKLNLSTDVVEDIYKDPFSYLGNIRYEDIYVVQKRYARKEGRTYISAFGGGGNFFSQFDTSLANGIGGGYYFSDQWGWEVFHGLFTHTFATQRHDLFLNQFKLWSGRLQFRINYALSSALTFSPFYGKFAFLGIRVLHYDIYFLAGPAVTLYEELTLGYGGIAGVGFRTFVNKWASLGLEFRDYVYLEPVPATFNAAFGSSEPSIASRFFVFLNLTVYFPKFAFMDEV